MNRRRFLLTATALLPAWTRPAAAARPLRIAFPDKSPPNSWHDEDGVTRGIQVDLLAELALRAGYDFQPVPLPLPRVQSQVESGALDGMCLVATPARREYAIPSAEPLTTGLVTLFVRHDNPNYEKLAAVKSLDDLAATGVTVIAIEGNGWVRQNITSRGITTVFANGTIGTVRMLIGKRGDVIADMSHQINWNMKRLAGGEDIVELPPVMDRVDWHLLISKKSPFAAEMDRLNAAIHELKASQHYLDILQKYGVKA
jgi:polar amino acid transport system substrate-binding protein